MGPGELCAMARLPHPCLGMLAATARPGPLFYFTGIHQGQFNPSDPCGELPAPSIFSETPAGPVLATLKS